MIKILLSGCNGRMGKAISEICLKNPNVDIIAGIDLYKEKRFDYPIFDDFNDVEVTPDVIIDF